jgi:predicted XRE-type DNA-binding protein
MSAGFRQTLLNVAAEQLGLKTDPVREKRQIEQSQFKQRQAAQALSLAKVARQTAYVGAALTAFATLGITVYLLRRTIQAKDAEG